LPVYIGSTFGLSTISKPSISPSSAKEKVAPLGAWFLSNGLSIELFISTLN
jgi:hypothetical protein